MQAKLGGGGNPVSTPSEPVVTAPPAATDGINSGVKTTTPATSGVARFKPAYGMHQDMPREVQ